MGSPASALYGITSERRLAEEVRLNLAFLWFLGYDLDERAPEHSVLSKARRRFGVTTYQAFFAEIVRQCHRAGLIRGDLLYRDSTLGKANARVESVGARALLAQLSGVDEHLTAVWGENPAAPADTEPAEPPEPAEPHATLPFEPPGMVQTTQADVGAPMAPAELPALHVVEPRSLNRATRQMAPPGAPTPGSSVARIRTRGWSRAMACRWRCTTRSMSAWTVGGPGSAPRSR